MIGNIKVGKNLNLFEKATGCVSLSLFTHTNTQETLIGSKQKQTNHHLLAKI